MTKYLTKNCAKPKIGKNILLSNNFLKISSLLFYSDFQIKQKISKNCISAKLLYSSYNKGYRQLKTKQANSIYKYMAGYYYSLRLRHFICSYSLSFFPKILSMINENESVFLAKSENGKFKIEKNTMNPCVIGSFKDIESSKFINITWFCIESIRNTIFRGDLKILLVELVKSKLYSLKLLKTILKAILNTRETSLSIKSLKLAKIQISLLKTILSQNYLSSNSIHSLIGGELS